MSDDPFVLLTWPRWAQMWTLALAIYIGCKWLTWQQAAIANVPAWKSSAYLLAWPGMDAASFVNEERASRGCRCGFFEWLSATLKLTLGVTLLFGVARMIPPQDAYIVGWIGMIGIVFILHFGVFHLLSCAWRRLGVDARPVMNRPWDATSLREFWGRRFGMTRAEATAINPNLLPLIAHDRAGFGGALASFGVAMLGCLRYAHPSRALWQALAIAGVVGFGTAVGVHSAIGYLSVTHIAPAVLGCVVFAAGLALTAQDSRHGRSPSVVWTNYSCRSVVAGST